MVHLDPRRTVAELFSPLEAFSGRSQALVSLLRSGNTSLEGPRPALPPGYVEDVPEVGDLFYRDTGRPPKRRSKGTLLLLHGWMVPSDPHWFRNWWMLHEEGFRVVAVDARGHGRGLRPHGPFRLDDCAEDAAALVRHLELGPVIAVGYSMGGTIAQLMALRHTDVVSGAVFCATGCEFRTSPFMRAVWSGMGLWQIWLRLAPQWSWRAFVQLVVQGDPETTGWLVNELRRGAPWDIAEAGREVGRFDSRPWLDAIEVPTAVVVTTVDMLVPPSRQRELARRLDAPMIEVRSDHLAPFTTPRRFHRALLKAIAKVRRERLQSVKRSA